MAGRAVCLISLLAAAACETNAFHFGSPSRNWPVRDVRSRRRLDRRWSVAKIPPTFRLDAGKDDDEFDRSFGDELIFFKADIPEEIRNEIFEAESNTDAGKERNERIATYTAVIVFGLTIAAFNTFLTGLLDDGEDLSQTMFGWIASNNPLNEFLFLNKFGGGIALVSAGICGVLVEVELRARRDNVEKIWREVRRRKEEREKGESRASKRKGRKSKKKAQKQSKRLAALSEVVVEEPDTEVVESPEPELEEAKKDTVGDEKTADNEEGGILGKMKDLYKKADDMAAAQALLLNKELEDRGVVDKITDESGLKVIGKEAAAKLQEEEAAKDDDKDEVKK